jgi:hypothetical protein
MLKQPLLLASIGFISPTKILGLDKGVIVARSSGSGYGIER